MRMNRRTTLALAAAAAFLAACGGVGGGSTTVADGDVAIGAAEAPVTITEYFSVTCGACRGFHEQVFGQIKTNYIDTGKVRWVFRELLTAPQEVSLAGFQVARCGGASGDQYIARVGAMFSRQNELLQGSGVQIRDRLVSIGQAAGLSREQLLACIDDESGRERALAFEDLARREDVTGTPTLFLDGRKLTSNYDYDSLAAAIDEQIAAAQ